MTRRQNREKRNPHPPLAISQDPRPPLANLRKWLLGGMMALVVARPLFPSESAAVFGDGLTMVMLWIVLAVFWLLGAIGSLQSPLRFSVRFGWTDLAVLALVGWHTVAALWAIKYGSPRPAINMLWEWVGMGLCYILARQFIATAREARAVIAVMVALAVALSGYGIYQSVYELPNTRAQYEADPNRALREADLWLPPDSPERQLFVSRMNSTGPTATFALTNSLAAFLAPWLVIFAWIIWSNVAQPPPTVTDDLHGRGRLCRILGPPANRRRLLGLLLCGATVVVSLLLTKSRSGCIAAGLGLILVWLLHRRRLPRIGWKMFAAVVATAAVLIATLVATGRLDRNVLGQATKSFGYRLQYWQSSMQMIADHPLVGCGPGNFQNIYTQYKLPEASEEVADPHNFLIEIWATAGTPAALAFLAMLVCFGWAISRNEGWAVHHPLKQIDSDACPYILAGGACGFLLSLPIGMLSKAPPGVAAVLLGLPLAAVTVMLLLNWIHNGQLPRWLPAAGVVVLLVDLATTGGIGLPSVAGTLWLLLALGLFVAQPPLADGSSSPVSENGTVPVSTVAGAWAALFITIALATACYYTAYSPVLNCQAQLNLAERRPTKAIEHLEAAATADPWAAEPWRRLAVVKLADWWQQPSQEGFDRFEMNAAKALELAPNSAPTWLAAGDWYVEAYSQMNQRGEKTAKDAVKKAVAAYQQAVRLYPNSAIYRAKLAEACRAAGDQAAFRREAQQALMLDDATPHSDKKLHDVRDRLLQTLGNKP